MNPTDEFDTYLKLKYGDDLLQQVKLWLWSLEVLEKKPTRDIHTDFFCVAVDCGLIECD